MGRRDDRTGLLPAGRGTVHVPASLNVAGSGFGSSLCGRITHTPDSKWLRPNVELPVCHWCDVKLHNIVDSIVALVALVETGRAAAETVAVCEWSAAMKKAGVA